MSLSSVARPDPAQGPARLARPNVFVVGDAKCGTTSLYFLFAAAPQIGTPRRKEQHYFSAPELLARTAGPGDEAIPANLVRDESTYLGNYVGIDPALPVIVDISPSYLRNPEAPARIRAFAPDARIVILLREPAAKVFSQYVHLWTSGQETLPFEEAYDLSGERRASGYSDMFDYENGGYYSAVVERYLAAFGSDRVLVILFEDLVGETEATKRRLSDFLDVPLPEGPLVHANIGGRVKNPLLAAFLGNPRMRRIRKALIPTTLRGQLAQAVRKRVAIEKPVLDPVMRTRLRQRYAEDVIALEQLIGRETGWPRT